MQVNRKGFLGGVLASAIGLLLPWKASAKGKEQKIYRNKCGMKITLPETTAPGLIAEYSSAMIHAMEEHLVNKRQRDPNDLIFYNHLVSDVTHIHDSIIITVTSEIVQIVNTELTKKVNEASRWKRIHSEESENKFSPDLTAMGLPTMGAIRAWDMTHYMKYKEYPQKG